MAFESSGICQLLIFQSMSTVFYVVLSTYNFNIVLCQVIVAIGNTDYKFKLPVRMILENKIMQLVYTDMNYFSRPLSHLMTHNRQDL